MTMNFNQEPYFDDFDENNQFYKILFRPSYAVQARELNQIQSILQNQTNSVGKHLFKEGSVVIPGKISYDSKCQYVKLQATNINSVDISSFISNVEFKIIVGQTSGVKAVVLKVESATNTDPTTLYVKYISGGASSSVFVDGEVIHDEDGSYSFYAYASSATGQGTIATLSEGVYYINNTFAKVFNSIIVLSKYTSTPSCRVGISWTESIVTPEDDNTLLDNALGSYNYAAPGAHRYKITTELVSIALTSSPENFIELINVDAGYAILTQVFPKYNEISDELARRTYKESGDYITEGFDIQLNEYRNNNMGSWSSNTYYYKGDIISHTVGSNIYYYQCIVEGTSGNVTPSFGTTFGITFDTNGSTVQWNYVENFIFNEGLTQGADPTKYVITNKTGGAFVKGYEYNTTNVLRLINSKPRDFDRQNNGTITIYDGTYVDIQNIYGYPSGIGSNFVAVNLYNQFTATPGTAAGTLVGTAKVRWMEKDSGSSNYRLYLYDIAMSTGYYFDQDCKQIQSTGFTSDIVPTLIQLSGSITAAASTTVTGTGTKFVTELSANDYITVDSTAALANMRRVSTVSTDVGVTLSTALTTTGTVFYLVKSKLNNTDYNSAIFKLPHTVIRNLKSADDITSDTRYTFTKDFGTFTAAGTTYALTLASGVETFASVSNAANYLLINTTTNAVVTTATYSVDGSSTTLTIGNLTNGTNYKLLGTVDKTASQRTKTLVVATPIDITTEAAINVPSISLGKADCYRVVAIKQAPAFGTITSGGANDATIDVSHLFKFDSGQTSLYYGLSSIKRINQQVKITGSIRIYFEYFSHSSGDYFTVESYTNALPYTEIEPKLRDTIDFRPVRNDADTGFNQATVGILKSGNNVYADYSYYLPRIDAMVLSKDKTISLINGVSSIHPKAPNLPVNTIALYYFYNSAYGGDPKQTVNVVSVPNKGYTMSDINDLENRIAKLEDYVSFTLLEKNTADLTIKDQQGYDMFKNGFIVEGFDDIGLGNISDADYRCFINSSSNELYPPQYEDNISFVENSNNTLRSGYVVKGDIITLDYEEVEYTSNIYASRPININPFSVASFVGHATLTPSSDVWMDTEILPTIYR